MSIERKASEGAKSGDPRPIWKIHTMVKPGLKQVGVPLRDAHCGERDGYRMGMRNGRTLKSKIG